MSEARRIQQDWQQSSPRPTCGVQWHERVGGCGRQRVVGAVVVVHLAQQALEVPHLLAPQQGEAPPGATRPGSPTGTVDVRLQETSGLKEGNGGRVNAFKRSWEKVGSMRERGPKPA